MLTVDRERGRPFFNSYWPERMMALMAVVGLAASISFNVPVARSEGAASDFKTMYASMYSLAHGHDAFDMQRVQAVFRSNGVVEPAEWYGHAPVYPPFTLTLLSPLAALRMVPAMYAWFGICCVALWAALCSLAQAAGQQFGLSRAWRMGVIAAGAAWPFCSFGLQTENVSVVAASLCVIAVVWPGGQYRWLRGAGLAVALLLKPHLALWVLIALAVLPTLQSRRLARNAAGLAVCLAMVLSFALVLRGQMGMQWMSYRAMLHVEMHGGSMSAGNHELLDISAQILSLDSLAGFFNSTSRVVTGAVTMCLASAALALLWAQLKYTGSALGRYPQVAVWCAFGMLATYHRAHDGIVLLILLPWLFARLQASARDGYAWMLLVCLVAMSASPDKESWWRFGSSPGLHGLSEFLLYRQAAVATLLLGAVLLSYVVSCCVYGGLESCEGGVEMALRRVRHDRLNAGGAHGFAEPSSQGTSNS